MSKAALSILSKLPLAVKPEKPAFNQTQNSVNHTKKAKTSTTSMVEYPLQEVTLPSHG